MHISLCNLPPHVVDSETVRFNSLSPCLPSDNTVISGDVNGER